MSSLINTTNGYFQIVTPTPSGAGGAALNGNFEGADAELQSIYEALGTKAGINHNHNDLYYTKDQTWTSTLIMANITSLLVQHNNADDPHGDRAYADSLFASLIPRGHLSGLTISNNSADPNNDLDIAAGEAVDESRSYLMRLASPITKRLDASWSAGSGNGGLFSGTKQPNTWYHVFLIRRDSDGALDVGFDASVTAANKPAGWSAYRRLGSRLTDGSGNLRRILQIGDRCYHSEAQVDYSAITPAAGWHTYALSTPPVPGVRTITGVIITDPEANPIVSWRPTGSTDSDGIYIARGIPEAQFRVSATVETDGDSQVDIRCSLDFTPGGNLFITTNGWIDTRGRL